MTHDTVMDKIRLAAFADGELPPEEAAEVVMHLADHPADQAYVDDLMAANTALVRAFEAPMTEEVPEAIRAAIFDEDAPSEAKVIPFRPRRVVIAGGAIALAASLALAAVIVPGLFSGGTQPERLALGAVEAASPLGLALDTLPSGTPQSVGEGREMMVLATLPVENGYCREIEVVDEPASRIDLGIACNRGAGWTVEVTLFEPLSAPGTEDGFVTAGGTEMQGLSPFLERLGAGIALDPKAEAEAIDQGWVP